jgi:hypothetical protein
VDPQRLVQRSVERGAVVVKLLLQLLLGLGLDEVGRRCAGALPLLLQMCRGAARSREGGARRRGPDAVSRAPSTAPLSSLTTSAPVGGSGAGAGRLTHWSLPGGGTSSSGISTTAAWLSSIGAGTDRTDGAMTVVVMAADGATTTCCDSAAAAVLRGPSLAAVAVLPAARSTLDERRLVGTVASDLNTLAGARGGTVDATLRTQRREIRHPPLKDMASGGAIAYLRVEKPRFLFLGGSAGVVAAADVAATAPPVASAVCAGASAARVASLVGCLVADALAPTPGAVSSVASTALGEGGVGSHLSERALPPPPSLSLLLLVRRRVFRSRRGGESLLLVQPKLLTSLFPVPPSSDSLLLLPSRPLLLPPLCHARARARGVGGSDYAKFAVTRCRE